MQPILSDSKGNITALVAGAIIVVVMLAVLGTVVTSHKTRVKANQAETAMDMASKKLEELLSIDWTHDQVKGEGTTVVKCTDMISGKSTPKTGTDCDDNEIVWFVTDIDSRLKKIQVVSRLVNKVQRQLAKDEKTGQPTKQGVLITGYKYYDFDNPQSLLQ